MIQLFSLCFCRSINYCRIFTEIAEALLHRMIESTKNNNGSTNSANLFGLLDLVLTCVGHHDYEVALVLSVCNIGIKIFLLL